MKYSAKNLTMALGVVVLGIAIAVGGVFLGEYDDAPGASLAAILLMIGAFVLAFRIARRKT